MTNEKGIDQYDQRKRKSCELTIFLLNNRISIQRVCMQIEAPIIIVVKFFVRGLTVVRRKTKSDIFFYFAVILEGDRYKGRIGRSKCIPSFVPQLKYGGEK